jgi:hypothetical protein
MATRMWTAAFIFLVLTSGVSTQEHAPTVDVCRADQAAWGNKQDQLEYARQELELSKNGTKDTSPAAEPSYEELISRRREMITCANVDPPNAEKYIDVDNFYTAVSGDRFENFIVRHHLMEQFLHEDAAGSR